MDQAGSPEPPRTTSQRRRGCAPGRLLAALLLAVAGWSLPPAARAGCAHDVRSLADAARPSLTDLDPLIAPGASRGGPWRAVPLGGPARPCSGFGCSRDSAPTPAAPPSAPRVDAWGRPDPPGLAPGPHPLPFAPDVASPHPLDRADRLTRPPRP